MSRTSFRSAALSIWLIAVLLFIGMSVAGGTDLTFSAVTLFLLLAVVPPILLSVLLRIGSPAKVGQIEREDQQRTAIAQRLLTIEQQVAEARARKP